MKLATQVVNLGTPPELEYSTNNTRVDAVVASNLEKSIGTDAFAEVLLLFVKDAKTKVSEIRQLVDEDNLSEVAASAHSLKSSSSMLGCVTLAELLRMIELEARNAESRVLESLTRQLPDILEETLAALPKHQNKLRV